MTELRVLADGATLAATVSPGNDVVLVALHGASDGTRASALYEHLHRVLPTEGIGVVTFDRRGEGASSGTPSVGRFDVQADDAIAVLESVGARRRLVWGYSQGAWVAPLVAARDPDVLGVVTIAACGITPYEQMQYGVRRHLVDAGFADAADEVLALRADVARAMRRDTIDEPALEHRLRAASLEPWWPHAYLRTPLPDAGGRDAWVAEMDYDPAPSMAALHCPILAWYGADDEWTPVAPSVRAWAALQPARAEVHVLDGASHALHDRSGTLDPRYEARLVAWLVERCAADDPTRDATGGS